MALWFAQKVSSFIEVGTRTWTGSSDLASKVTSDPPMRGFFVQTPDGHIRTVAASAVWDSARRAAGWGFLETEGGKARLSQQGMDSRRRGKFHRNAFAAQLSDALEQLSAGWSGNRDVMDLHSFVDAMADAARNRVPSKCVLWKGFCQARPRLVGDSGMTYRLFGELLSLAGHHGAGSLRETVIRLHFAPSDNRWNEIRADDASATR